MNKNIIVLSMVFSFVSVNTSFAAKLDKRYTIKSGILEYKVTGVQEGTETLYFENYGRKEARHRDTTTKFLGITQRHQDVNYLEGEYAYGYNPKKDEATKIKIGDVVSEMKKSSDSRTLRDFGEKILKDIGGKKIGTKTIVNKKCDVWEVSDWATTTCIYKGSVPLEVNANFGGIKMHQVAISFQENVKIPQDKINLPKTASIKDLGSFEDVMRNPSGMDGAMPAQNDGQEFSLGDFFKAMSANEGDVKKQQSEAMKAAQDSDLNEELSKKELELREKELELERMKLELERKKLEDSAQASQNAQDDESALDNVNKTLDTTNKIKNTFSGFKSLLGK